MAEMGNPREILSRLYGHTAFREGQESLIQALLQGRDVLGVMPTGGGKSLCYQIPGLCLPGITLVVSPLISLMKDQVAALKENGVPGAYINSTLTPVQITEALHRARNGMYKIMYIAPERLLTSEFLYFAKNAEISLLAVDEAHCISQWGQDFRPSYRKIPDFLATLPKRPPVGAFTATATKRVQEDILELLGLQSPLVQVTGFDRPNLFFSVEQPRNRERRLLELLEERRQQSGIVYCSTRKAVESICELLLQKGYPAVRYHAGLTHEERLAGQEDFQYDRARIMVATNAFGMGIDKSNVQYVLHYNMPMDLESYYQEAGRAGRDGSPADCILLYSGQDYHTCQWLIDNAEENPELSPEETALLRHARKKRLQEMLRYATFDGCLRNKILRYFGEYPSAPCGHCSACRVEPPSVLPRIAQRKEALTPADEALYERLVQLRRQIAGQMRVPVYIVFTDATLREMAAKKPVSSNQMWEITGVGQAKMERYGMRFLLCVQDYLRHTEK